MIGGLRRRLSRDVGYSWSTDQELKPEVAGGLEIHDGGAPLLPAPEPIAGGETNDVSMKDYYKGVVATAIERGGSCRGQMMSVNWLRMILAGLESRPYPPDALWEVEQTAVTAGPGDAVPPYADLFPLARSQSHRYG